MKTLPPTKTAIPVSGPKGDEISSAKSSPAVTPRNKKAGIAGGDAYPFFKDHIGWWYDWSPTPSKPGKPITVPMLWGGGAADGQDTARLEAFKALKTIPQYVLGFEEPDCPSGSGWAGMSVAAAVDKWECLIAPMKRNGTRFGSPSMCKQADETWLAEFTPKVTTPWDFTAIHITKNNLGGVKKDIEHYSKYGKAIWVTEFACVNGRCHDAQCSIFVSSIDLHDSCSYYVDHPNFVPCTSHLQIDAFINQTVSYLEAHPNVYAYAYSNGQGLGDVWPLMRGGKAEGSASGKTYLAAVSKFH
ncbi:glycosyl hydrolase catalytic core-domain-containing protein [Coprinopsis sp. MPI-PUGE-AT-0042]|nr:glycosyl hydrolase catalytic core-domain-containing protein [Coprinopsis sp. MPI-PUGE-AT-0042]